MPGMTTLTPLRAGNIGEPVRHIEFEPFPDTVPAEPAVTPVAPVETPEPVPA